MKKIQNFSWNLQVHQKHPLFLAANLEIWLLLFSFCLILDELVGKRRAEIQSCDKFLWKSTITVIGMRQCALSEADGTHRTDWNKSLLTKEKKFYFCLFHWYTTTKIYRKWVRYHLTVKGKMYWNGINFSISRKCLPSFFCFSCSGLVLSFVFWTKMQKQPQLVRWLLSPNELA